MADDAEMAVFLQKLMGYGCTGEVCEEIFPVFTGNGRNSKGVLDGGGAPGGQAFGDEVQAQPREVEEPPRLDFPIHLACGRRDAGRSLGVLYTRPDRTV